MKKNINQTQTPSPNQSEQKSSLSSHFVSLETHPPNQPNQRDGTLRILSSRRIPRTNRRLGGLNLIHHPPPLSISASSSFQSTPKTEPFRLYHNFHLRRSSSSSTLSSPLQTLSTTKITLGLPTSCRSSQLFALFLLYSVTGLSVNHVKTIALSSSVPDFVALFAFGQEFFFFYTQRKDPNGVENQYYNLLLAPITICVFSTVLLLGRSGSDSKFPRMARGVGLILQGTWFIQMGFSFYTGMMTHGCNLVEKSRGNFTVMCKGHDDYHRSKAISTLQFNCHLLLLVVLITGVYSIIARMYEIEGNHLSYKPLNAELSQLGQHTQFTFDSDDDEVAADENGAKPMDVGIGRKLGVNGFGAH